MSLLRSVALALAAVAAAPAHGEDRGPTADGRPVSLQAMPVEVLPGATADGVAPVGAWVLAADDAAFGGLSGLVVEGDRLTSVTDRGVWLTARVSLTDGALALAEARMAPMLDEDGAPLDGDARDAEGLARVGEAFVVSFERDHRVARHVGGGRLSVPRRAPGFADLEFNAGLEGLAVLPDGRLFALAEGRTSAGFPAFLLSEGETRAVAALPARSRHDVTGADATPDGTFYVLQRHFSRATGVSIRLLRYPSGPEGLPDPNRAVELAAWETASGIDNMEGLAATPRPDGAPGHRLWIVSDDNFNAPFQRTLIVVLDVGP